MAERIYLGALIDINKEPYLPIMNEVLTEINMFTPGTMQGRIQEFDTTSFIVYINTLNMFRIFNSATLAVIRDIIPAKGPSGGSFVLTEDRTKMYYINTLEAGVHQLNTYVFATNTETTQVIDLRGDNTNILGNIGKILLDEENEQFIYAFSANLRRFQKISLQECAVVATSPMLGGLTLAAESADVGGGFLYVATGDSNYSYLTKVDKTTLQAVATSAQTYYRGTSAIQHLGLKYKDGYVYTLTGITSSGYSLVKVDAVTLSIIAKNEPGGATVAEGIFLTRDNRIFGAMGVGTNATAMHEYDINTVALIKSLTSATTMAYGKNIFHHVESGRTLFGTQAKMSQAERSYTIASYKKLKEDAWR
ncbi:MAG TPA: hypothetical protein VEZ13_12090 [Brevibacillus sp.]|nr:hypothetical protein [Brevibacillus sp.]